MREGGNGGWKGGREGRREGVREGGNGGRVMQGGTAAEKEERKLPAVDSELERRASQGALWVQ